MTKDQWVSDNYYNIHKWLRNTTRGKRPELYEDFVHEMMLIFLEHPKAQEVVDRDEARWFLTRIALNQWRSTTSPWAKQNWNANVQLYMDFEAPLDEYAVEDDALMELMIGILDDMHLGNLEEYYMSLVVMIYHELDGNFSEMSRRLDIPRTSLSKVYKEAIRTIEKRLIDKIKELENGTITISHSSAHVLDRWNELCSTAQRKTRTVHLAAVKSGFLRDL